MPSYSLNNFSAPDRYLGPGQTVANGAGAATGPATLAFLPPVDHINLDVSNAAVFWSLMQTNELASPDTGTWQPETFMTPGSRVITRANVTGIRVRAAVAGQTGTTLAQITVEAVES